MHPQFYTRLVLFKHRATNKGCRLLVRTKGAIILQGCKRLKKREKTFRTGNLFLYCGFPFGSIFRKTYTTPCRGKVNNY